MTRNLQPLYTRPFSLSDAIAGAPYALACGWPVEIFRWDAKSAGGPILGIFGTDDRISTWRANGEFSIQDNPRLNLVMVPLGYLDGKPVFVGDQLLTNLGELVPVSADWRNECLERWWRWPAPPKVYPRTSMAEDEIQSAWGPEYGWKGLCVFANTAIRHYIDNLTVLPDNCALRAKLVEMGWTPPDTQVSFPGLMFKWREDIPGYGKIEGAKEVVQSIKTALTSCAGRDTANTKETRND